MAGRGVEEAEATQGASVIEFELLPMQKLAFVKGQENDFSLLTVLFDGELKSMTINEQRALLPSPVWGVLGMDISYDGHSVLVKLRIVSPDAHAILLPPVRLQILCNIRPRLDAVI